jgi:adenylate kinase
MSDQLRIILLGPPGAGKGTQAVLICEARNIVHISTGDMLRAAIAAGSDLGKQVKSFLDNGELVPDSLMIDLMRDRLSQADCANGFLLDGFPRTLDQASALDELLTQMGIPLTHVLELKVEDQILIDRIKKRGEESGRTDDNAEVVANRLQVYWKQTAPVTNFYKEKNLVKDLDGLGTIEEVQQRVLQLL